MQQSFDIMVAGLGANGSSTLYHLSKTSKKIIGIDRFHPPHTHGSSHGESRIIRQAYYEDPKYVPLLVAAYRQWTEIEQTSGKTLFRRTGGLMIGNRDTAVVNGSLLSAKTHGIPYEYLDDAALKERFPAFRPSRDTVGILEKEAGILFPEDCISTFLAMAAAAGAGIHYNETILQINPKTDKVEVITTAGKYLVEQLVLTAGAWTTRLLPGLNLPLTVARQPLHWFRNADAAEPARFLPGNMPVYIWEYAENRMFYGFPDLGTGIKIAIHHEGRPIEPGQLTQDVSPEEIEEIKDIAAGYLDITPVYDRSTVCMYTNAPEGNFIIDFHPGCRNIIIASPCSGHGFKFSSLTGKILSDMATGKDPGFDLSSFSIPSVR